MLKLLADHGEELFWKVGVNMEMSPLDRAGATYEVQPILVDLVTCSGSGELNAELATVRVGGIFPLGSDALFEEMIV